MPATGIFVEAINALKATITGLGYKVVTDPRNVRPLTVYIEPPMFTSFTYNVGDLTCRVSVLAPPPGNQDASDYLMTVVDALMNSTLPIQDGRPGSLDVGGQVLPCYDLTIRIASRRN
jgi:hypothetical protein